jgi:hypothetical protein
VSNNIEIKSGTTVNLSTPEKNAISLSVPERSITNVNIKGLKSVGKSDANYVHNQTTASNVWTVNHGLNKFPSVTTIDSSERVVFGEIEFVDENNVVLTFKGSFKGKAFFN